MLNVSLTAKSGFFLSTKETSLQNRSEYFLNICRKITFLTPCALWWTLCHLLFQNIFHLAIHVAWESLRFEDDLLLCNWAIKFITGISHYQWFRKGNIRTSQWHEVYCHDLEVMSSNPGWVELGVLGTSVLSRTWTKNINKSDWWPSGYSRRLSNMKCTVMIWRSWVQAPTGLNLGCVVLLS